MTIEFKESHIFEDAVVHYMVNASERNITDEYRKKYESQKEWRAPTEIIRSLLVPYMNHKMVLVKMEGGNSFYMTCDERGYLRRIIEVPGAKEPPKKLNPVPYWTIYHSGFIEAKDISFSIDRNTSYTECSRRFWIAAFNSMFKCGWKNFYDFIL